MDIFAKINISAFLIGFMLILVACGFQASGNRPVADMFGYTGLAILALCAMAVMLRMIVFIWSEI